MEIPAMAHQRYHQSTGMLEYIEDGGRAWELGDGWAGNDSRPGVNPTGIKGRNNPAMQSVHLIGPLPQGWYTIGLPQEILHPEEGPHPRLGPLAFPLTPDPANEMYGRSGFFMHGASSRDPLNSSEGCIIQAHDVRVQELDLIRSGANRLEVVA